MVWYNSSNQSSTVLGEISRDGLLPPQQQLFGIYDIFKMVDKETLGKVVPFIVGLQEGYFKKSIWVSLISSSSWQLSAGVPGQGGILGPNVTYQMPPDSVGNRLHDAAVFFNNANQRTLPVVTDYQAGRSEGWAHGIYVEGDHFSLYPPIAYVGAKYLRLSYYAQPLPLCDDSGTRTDGPTGTQIQSVNLTTGVIGLTVLPANWSATTPLNFIDGNPSFSTKVWTNILSVNVNAGTITVDPATLVNVYGQQLVNVNDWAADAGFSPVLQLPREAVQLATQATVARMLRNMGNEAWSTADQALNAMLVSAMDLFAPRIDDSPKVLVNLNGGVRRGRSRGNGFGW